MNLNHVHFNQCEKLSQEKPFTSGQIFNKFHTVVAKSTTEPRNSTNPSVANTSTPKNNRAFFVRSVHTPKGNNQTQIGFVVFPSNEFNRLNFELVESLSMVACSGKGFALCCVPLIAVFEPVTRYRQSLETDAVTSSKFSVELSAMLTYLFKAISRRDLSNTSKPINQMTVYTLRKQAESEQQARAFFAPFYVILEGGKLC